MGCLFDILLTISVVPCDRFFFSNYQTLSGFFGDIDISFNLPEITNLLI